MTYPDAISDAALDATKIAARGAAHNSAEDFAVGEMIDARRRFAEDERAARREAVCRVRMTQSAEIEWDRSHVDADQDADEIDARLERDEWEANQDVD